MDQLLAFLIAIVPMIVVFVGLVFFKKGGTLMGFVGWLLTILVAIVFFDTSLSVAINASIAGILASFGISLMVLFTILQVTMMDVTGAIKSITEFIKTIAAERYEQIMLLNVGLGTFLVAIGATPVTMLPPIMLALGFSPLAAIALPCLGYDPLTSFSLLAVPIKSPADTFGLNASMIAQNVALFLPVISTGVSLGMLWVADGWNGVKKGFITSILAGLTLGVSAIIFVNYFPSYLQLTGVFAGLAAIVVLLLYRVVQGKPIFVKKDATAKAATAADGGATKKMPLWRALSPWILLVVFCLIISPPNINKWLLDLLGNTQIIGIYTNQSVNLKLLTQAYVWVLVSTVITAPILIRNRTEAAKTLTVWIKRAWAPTLAAMVFFAIAYVMFWSAKTVNSGGQLVDLDATQNMNYVIGVALATYLGAFLFPFLSPLLGLFGGFVSGSETSSNVMFYKILDSATGKLASAGSTIDLTKVFAGHAVAGGVASGIAVAKIVNAAAVIDKIGMEGEVIKKSAAVVIVLALVTGLMLGVWVLLT